MWSVVKVLIVPTRCDANVPNNRTQIEEVEVGYIC